MTKLNQTIAIEKGIKSRVYGEVTELNKVIQKPDLFNGFYKSYQKKDEDGEDLPSEKKRVQFQVSDVLNRLAHLLTEMMTVTAQKDWTNCIAVADVTIDGSVLIPGVPVSYLLFMEKQLTDVRTFISNLPVLDESESWTKDVNSGLYKTDGINTHRTKKIARPIVLYPATPEHPAQTQLITEDIIAGFWQQVKQSGALPKPDRQTLLERVENLLQAVKQAREAANAIETVPSPGVGDAVFNYIFGASSNLS